ncbi:MAG TPA: DUF1614 domain-containing protein [Methylococcus sp.]|nr:DUF1614 domain-containing protein [Methylococcus sp.]
MRSPFSPFYFFFFIGLLLWIVFSIKLELITLTFEKLGLDPGSALMLMATSLFGSAINLPLGSVKAERPPEPPQLPFPGLLRPPPIPFTGRTQIAVNVGGGLVPLFFSIYLLRHSEIPLLTLLLAILIVAIVAYWFSRPIPGFGIGMPILIAPLTAALTAILLGGEYKAPLAYIAGTLGVLIGADLLRIGDIRRMGTPIASIGGAGTFDGIFMTGLVAVLLT